MSVQKDVHPVILCSFGTTVEPRFAMLMRNSGTIATAKYRTPRGRLTWEPMGKQLMRKLRIEEKG
jgi:hypothetical protein